MSQNCSAAVGVLSDVDWVDMMQIGRDCLDVDKGQGFDSAELDGMERLIRWVALSGTLLTGVPEDALNLKSLSVLCR